jgi:peptidoglycan lytic transglycosylase B
MLAPHHVPVTGLVGLLVAATLVIPRVAAADASHQGWTYVIDRLIADGLDPARVARVFDDPRMEPFDGLEFGLNPREPHAMYRGFLRGPSLAAARRCRREHADALEAAERATGVSASLVTAILHVETGCGRNTGSSPLVYRLARLAMANEPENLAANMERLAGEDPSPELARRVESRAQYLEDTFYPEVRAVFELSDRLGVDPLELRGSGSGAFGYPQFLPTSYLRFGMDGSGDGRVDLFDIGDASASCANYLAAQGWRKGLTDKQRRAVIWRYNRSDAYVSTVLALARSLDGGPVSTARSRKRAPARKPQARTKRASVSKKKTATKKRATMKRTVSKAKPKHTGSASAEPAKRTATGG